MNGDGMVCFLTKTYDEARLAIGHYSLKRTASPVRGHEIFSGSDAALIVGGVDVVSVAVSAAVLLSQPTGEDIFINYGFDGRLDGIMLLNRLFDPQAGRCFYPEMLYKHPFSEGFLDGEAGYTSTYAFQAAASFLSLERIIIARFSGALDAGAFFLWVTEISHMQSQKKRFSKDEQLVIDRVAGNLKLTASMRAEFEKLCSNYKNRHGTLDPLSDYLDISVQKQEGKKYYGAIRAELASGSFTE